MPLVKLYNTFSVNTDKITSIIDCRPERSDQPNKGAVNLRKMALAIIEKAKAEGKYIDATNENGIAVSIITYDDGTVFGLSLRSDTLTARINDGLYNVSEKKKEKKETKRRYSRKSRSEE